MKTKLCACVILALGVSGFAAEIAPASAQYSTEGVAPMVPPAPRVLPRTVWPQIKLADGRVLERARANAEDAATVTFLHAGGVSKVDKRLLPVDLAQVFAFDPAAAASEAARNAQAARAAAAANRARIAQAPAQPGPEMVPVTSSLTIHRPDMNNGVGGTTVRTTYVPRPVPAAPAARSAGEAAELVQAAAQRRARIFFENEKRTGSGATLVFGVECELDEPVALSGWDNRWEVAGTAFYKVYDSVGSGSFSSRKKRFRAFVEVPPGRPAKVIDFEER